MALAANSKRPKAFPQPRSAQVAADVVIYGGALVVLNSSGYAAPGTAATGLVAYGVCPEGKSYDSTGLSAGDLVIPDLQTGIFGFKNKSGDEVTIAEIGDVCYISTDEEVCKTSTGKSVAGVVEFIEDSLVYVNIGLWPLQVGLLAANNLSDVGSAATARANLSANRGHFTLEKISSKASDAEVGRIVAGSAGTITGFKSVLNGALATGDATFQLKINGTNVGSTTTGLITATQSGSAAGDVDTTTPLTTNLTFAAGDVISVTGGGASTATATANFVIEYTF